MIEENQDHEEQDDQDLPQDPEGESTADETDGGGDDGAGANAVDAAGGVTTSGYPAAAEANWARRWQHHRIASLTELS